MILLGSCFGVNDGVWVRVMVGRVPLSRDGRFANRPYGDGLRPVFAWRCGREHSPPGARSPFDFPQGERAPLPLWIAAFAGVTRRGRGSPHANPPTLPCPSGYRLSPVRRGGGGGARRERETARRLAPALGSRESGNDDGGGRAGEGCWCRRGRFPPARERRWGGRPALAGRAVREPPLRCVGCAEVRVAEGEVPACAGTTMGRGNDGRGEAPFVCSQDRLRRAQGERNWELALRLGRG